MDLRKITNLFNLTTPFKEDNLIESPKKEYFIKQEPLEELFSWRIQIPNFRISKKILRSAFVFVFLFAIFLVLAQDWVFLLVLLGFSFIVNLLLNNKDNREIQYKIYNNGFTYGEVFYSWEELSQFFYYEGTSNLIVIDSKDTIPGRMYVYFDPENRDKIEELLNKYLSKSLVHPKDFYELVIFKIKPYLNLSEEK
jgi:hypothetical protein